MKGRPVAGGPNFPTQGVSCYLEKILTPIVLCLKTHIKDDWNFIRKLPSRVDYPCVFTSYDVVSLYMRIPHDLGLEALSYWVDKKWNLIPECFTKAFILEAASFVLPNNNIQFDSYMFLHLAGTAMGAKFASPYACLSAGLLEETILFPRLLPITPTFYIN